MRASLMLSAWVMGSFALVGCGKIQEMIKGSAGAPDAAPSAPVVAAPSAPEPVPTADAAPATTATATATTTTAKPKPKDGGAGEAGAPDAGPVDAGAVADAAVALQKPTRGKFMCDPAGCLCQAAASCDISCPGGVPCSVTVAEGATAQIGATSAPLNVTCNKGSTCKVRGGAGPSNTKCVSANCEVDCRSGPCDLSCAGGKCAVNKKGSGPVKCTGCS